jgi:hypothetical protein
MILSEIERRRGMPVIDEHRVEEAERQAGATADDLQERSDDLGGEIEETRSDWEAVKQDTSVPTAAGDWEDTEPDDATGEDPTGFDDPESLELDDEDLADDDLVEEDEEDY